MDKNKFHPKRSKIDIFKLKIFVPRKRPKIVSYLHKNRIRLIYRRNYNLPKKLCLIWKKTEQILKKHRQKIQKKYKSSIHKLIRSKTFHKVFLQILQEKTLISLSN